MLKSRRRSSAPKSPPIGNGRENVEVSAGGRNLPLTTVDWADRWCCVQDSPVERVREVYEFEAKDSDVYVITFPKSGTTWMQEAAWLLMNDLDFGQARSVDLRFRSIFLEMSILDPQRPSIIEKARELQEPRILKSHFPMSLVPRTLWDRQSKIIYCARNPKDVVISYYRFFYGMGRYEGSLADFVEDFMADNIIFCPYWQHISEFWQLRQHPKIFFTTYEDMKRDLSKVLIDLNRFLGKPDMESANLQQLVQHLSFESMKENHRANPTEAIKANRSETKADFQFLRRGIIGSYKDEMPSDVMEKFDKWIAENEKKFNINLKDIFGDF